MASEVALARAAAEKLGLRLPATDEGVVKFVLLNALESLERARVVGVLDAWAAAKPRREWTASVAPVGEHWCLVREDGHLTVLSKGGASADEARARAAKSVEAEER